jgi:hypothetical protein
MSYLVTTGKYIYKDPNDTVYLFVCLFLEFEDTLFNAEAKDDEMNDETMIMKW